MKRHQDPDEWLMAQVAKGNRNKLEPLVRRYSSPLLTFILRMVGDVQRSEDLFQEVFLSVWVNRNQYSYSKPFRPWLYQIAINKCRASFRRRRLPLALSGERDLLDIQPTSDSQPDVIIEGNETASMVVRAVDDLPAKQKVVVVLRIWSGLSYRQIAETLRSRESTVRSRMFHALKAMRRHLEPGFAPTSEISTKEPCDEI